MCNDFATTCNLILQTKAKGEARVAQLRRQRVKLEAQRSHVEAKNAAAARITAANVGYASLNWHRRGMGSAARSQCAMVTCTARWCRKLGWGMHSLLWAGR
jgi:hypothetical protein